MTAKTPQITALLTLIDAYKAANGIDRDTTVSNRIFRDTSKIKLLRAGRDITTDRINFAVQWLREHWPELSVFPEELAAQIVPPVDDDVSEVAGQAVGQ